MSNKYICRIDESSIYDPFAQAIRSKGSYIWMDGDDEPYIDLLMGYSSTNFGHVNKDILKFVIKAVKKFDNLTSFNSCAKIELSRKLIDLLPFKEDRLVYFPVGGAKAIDAAIKLAKAFTKKDLIVSFEGGFHGYSYAGMMITDGKYIDKKQYGSMPGAVKFFSFPNRQSGGIDAQRILEKIESFFKKNNKKIAAIVFEPVQGAAGFIIPPDDFLRSLLEIAKKHNVVTICDEIQTGVGRTGSLYYINQLKISTDIVLLGKSLAGGYYPLSAVIGRRELFNAINRDRPGFDSTFANSLLGIEIANDVIDYIKNENILELVNKNGTLYFNELSKVLRRFSFIKELDGIGMAYGYRVEAKSENVLHSAFLTKEIRKEAYKNHLIIQAAGVDGNHMKMSPNFFISDDEIAIVMTRLLKTLSSVSSRI